MPNLIQPLTLLGCILAELLSGPALAQQSGGVLRFYHRDSPASASIHEEATISSVAPFMGVFNNLVIFKQDEKQNRPEFVVPEPGESWSWRRDYTRLEFRLRQGVKWHDGRPFTARDVKCTWDILAGKSDDKLRLNPRKAWYRNLDEVTTDDDYSVTFVLKHPQPAFLMLLANGMSPVYPCQFRRARCARTRLALAHLNSPHLNPTNIFASRRIRIIGDLAGLI
jgi:peptide/nickel transport system substrate-binding protein